MQTLQQKIDRIYLDLYSKITPIDKMGIDEALQEFREQIEQRIKEIENLTEYNNLLTVKASILAYRDVLALIGEQTNA